MNRSYSIPRYRSGKPRAQAIVEFALVLPLLLLVLVGIFEFSRLLFAWIVLENSTRFGIRYATTGIYDDTYCTSMFGGPCDTDAEVDAARIPSIEDETTRIVLGFFLRDTRDDPSVTTGDDTYFNVTVCSDERVFVPPVPGEPVYASCSASDGTASEHAGSPGVRVYVAADYNFRFMVFPLFGFGPSSIHLASYRQGFVEQFRATRAINTPLPMNIPTNTLPPSLTPTITETPPPTPTNTHTPTTPPNTPTPTRTLTQTPTVTRTRTVTNTPGPTRTPTVTRTRTLTPTITRTPTISLTPSRTLSPTITRTRTITPTRTRTPTLGPATATRTRTRTPTLGPPTNTRTRTPTPGPVTPTRTRTPTPIVPTNTRTPTPPPPTNTRTPTPNLPTNTPRPPTNTPRPTICADC